MRQLTEERPIVQWLSDTDRTEKISLHVRLKLRNV